VKPVRQSLKAVFEDNVVGLERTGIGCRVEHAVTSFQIYRQQRSQATIGSLSSVFLQTAKAMDYSKLLNRQTIRLYFQQESESSQANDNGDCSAIGRIGFD